MPSLFTKIINEEIPARLVWRDDKCVAFLTINPLAPGHTLVVPVEEIDHWIDLPAESAAHLWAISQQIGKALQAAFSPSRVGVIVVGEEVPHAHIHLVPFDDLSQMNFANADSNPDPAEQDAQADAIRKALAELGS